MAAEGFAGKTWIAPLTGTTIIIMLQSIQSTYGRCPVLGTTPGVRDLVLGRCLDYQNSLHPRSPCEGSGSSNGKNCTELADLFLSSFAYQSTCNVSFSRYDAFIQAAQTVVRVNQAMFWSDVSGVVHRYSNNGLRATVLANTLIGYLLHGLHFCAQENSPGIINNLKCSGFEETATCSLNAEFSFWAMASRNFALHARGEVRVMLNSSLQEAFYETSFFAVWEVPNMNNTRVKRVTIWLVHIPGHEIRSTCKSESIVKLQNILLVKEIASACEDSPRGPQDMLCVDFPGEDECVRDVQNSNRADPCTIPDVLFAITLVLSVYYSSAGYF